MREFFGCYLLVSLAPEGKGRTYIGFTVNPRRRIRQHNGLIKAGAWKTSRGRPWEMTLVLYGFPTKIQALQFEWAWQHPQRSVIVRPIAQALGSKKLQGVRGKILLMLSMLHESPWRHFPLTLQYLHPKYAAMIKENVVSAPSHIRVHTAPMEELPRAIDDVEDDEGDEAREDDQGADDDMDGGLEAGGKRSGRPDGAVLGTDSGCSCDDAGGASGGEESDGDGEPVELIEEDRKGLAGGTRRGHPPAAAAGGASNARLPCQICQVVIQRHILVCCTCSVAFHLDCLAAHWSSTEAARSSGCGGDRFGGVPEQGHCPACGAVHSWMGMLRGMQTIGWGNKPRGRRGRQAKKVAGADGAAAGSKGRSGAKAAKPGIVVAEESPADGAAPKARKRVAKPKAAPADTAETLNTGDWPEEQQRPEPAVAQRRRLRAEAGVGVALSRRKATGSEAAASGTAAPAGDAGTGLDPSAPAAPKRRGRAPKARMMPAAAAPAPTAGEQELRALDVEDEAGRSQAPLQPAELPPKRRRCAKRPQQATVLLPAGAQAAGPARLQQDTTAALPSTSDDHPSAVVCGDAACGTHAETGLADPSPVPLWRRLQARAAAGPAVTAGTSQGQGPGLAGAVKGHAAEMAADCPKPRRISIFTGDLVCSSIELEEGGCVADDEDGYNDKDDDEAAAGSLALEDVQGLGLSLREVERAAELYSPSGGAEQCVTMVGCAGDPCDAERHDSDSGAPVPTMGTSGQHDVLPLVTDVVILGTTSDSSESDSGSDPEGCILAGARGNGTARPQPPPAQCRSPLVQHQACAYTPSTSDGVGLGDDFAGQPPPAATMGSQQPRGGWSPDLPSTASAWARVGPCTGQALGGAMAISPAPGGPSISEPGTENASAGRAGKSPGSGLAVLLSQLQCSTSTASPQGDELQPHKRVGAGQDAKARCTSSISEGVVLNAAAAAEAALTAGDATLVEGAAVLPGRHTLRLARGGDTGLGSGAAGGPQDGKERPRRGHADVQPPARITQVVDLCTPLPLRSRLACRAAKGQEAAGDGNYLAGAAPMERLAELGAGKRLRSPLPGRTHLGPHKDDDGGELNGSSRGTVVARSGCGRGDLSASACSQELRVDRAASCLPPSAAGGGAAGTSATGQYATNDDGDGSALAHGTADGGAAASEWSISPWPQRQRRESPRHSAEGAEALGAGGEEHGGGSARGLTVFKGLEVLDAGAAGRGAAWGPGWGSGAGGAGRGRLDAWSHDGERIQAVAQDSAEGQNAHPKGQAVDSDDDDVVIID